MWPVSGPVASVGFWTLLLMLFIFIPQLNSSCLLPLKDATSNAGETNGSF
jgi:hypothetical protein